MHDIVISTNFKGDIRPDKIIPFSQTFKNFADAYWGYIANSKYVQVGGLSLPFQCHE